MKRTLSFLIVGTLMISTTAAISRAGEERPDQASSGPMARPMHGPDPIALMQRALHRLDLTEAQKQQIKAILDAHRGGITEARDARAASVKAFSRAVQAGDEAAIRTAGTALGNAIADAAVIRVQTVAAIKRALTKEQIQRLEAMKERAKLKEINAFRRHEDKAQAEPNDTK